MTVGPSNQSNPLIRVSSLIKYQNKEWGRYLFWKDWCSSMLNKGQSKKDQKWILLSSAIRKRGCDLWCSQTPSDLLQEDENPSNWSTRELVWLLLFWQEEVVRWGSPSMPLLHRWESIAFCQVFPSAFPLYLLFPLPFLDCLERWCDSPSNRVVHWQEWQGKQHLTLNIIKVRISLVSCKGGGGRGRG